MTCLEPVETLARISFSWLQVLSTLYAAESVRSDQDRNILEVTAAVQAFMTVSPLRQLIMQS